MPTHILLFAFPLAALAAGFALFAGVLAWRGIEVPGWLLFAGRALWAALFVTAIVLALTDGRRTYPWLEWSVACPMVGLAANSGLVLADARGTPDAARARRSLVVFAALVSLALVPLVLVEVFPAPPNDRYPRDRAGLDVLELIAWGFGGDVPGLLRPILPHEVERGLGYLSRDVTVSATAMWIGSWCVLLFGLVSLLVAHLRSPRARAFVAWISPLGAGIALGFLVSDTSTIWRAEPQALRTFGLLTGLVGGASVLWLAWTIRRATRTVDPSGLGR